MIGRVFMRLAQLKKEANEKMRILAEAYAKVPKNKKQKAYKIYLDLAEGKISYEEALERLKKLSKA